MKKYFFAILMLLIGASALWAQEVKEAEALLRAQAFLGGNGPHKVKGQGGAQSLKLAHTSKGKKGNNYFAYNIGEGDGFILVSAEEQAEQILGYTESGNFDLAKMPDNLKWWLSQYDQQIEAVRKYNASQESASAKAPVRKASKREARHDIEPMIKTQWDQTDPYNSMIPKLDPSDEGIYTMATGCIATGIAQIMNYYKYPQHGIGSNGYIINYENPNGGVQPVTFEADFANTTYRWDLMKETYDGSESQEERDAIGTLLYHAGVANEMLYGQFAIGGSTAIIQNIPNAIIDYFGYDKSTTCEDRDWYTTGAWEQMVYEELAAGRPVLYSGLTEEGYGHTFVCSGYHANDNHYHMNWGWSGYCDGYFVLTATQNEEALKPNGTGSGGGAEDDSYSFKQLIEKNFMPDQGNDYACHMMSSGTYSLDRNTADNDEWLALLGGFFNHSLVTQRVAIGARLENVSTGVSFNMSGIDYDDIVPNSGYSGYYVHLTGLPDGHYRVYPAFSKASQPDVWEDFFTSQLDIPIVTIGNPAPMTPDTPGDVDGDGQITVTDLAWLIDYLNGRTPAGFHRASADVNGDHQVDKADADELKAILLGTSALYIEEVDIENIAVKAYLGQNLTAGPIFGESTWINDNVRLEKYLDHDTPVGKIVAWEGSDSEDFFLTLSDLTEGHRGLDQSVTVTGNSHEFYNLVPGHTYRYTVAREGGEEVKSGLFRVKPNQLRMVKISDSWNWRDLGGWASTLGGHVRYEWLYRGGSLNGTWKLPFTYGTQGWWWQPADPDKIQANKASEISDPANYEFSQTSRDEILNMGIHGELDFRNNKSEAPGDDMTHSISLTQDNHSVANTGIDGWLFKRIRTANAIGNPFTEDAVVQDVKWLIEQVLSGHPIAYHCRSGADRTGVVSFIILALLGVDETDIAKDYELTLYSSELGRIERRYPTFQVRHANVDYWSSQTFLARGIKTAGYPCTTLQERAYYYLNQQFPSCQIPASQLDAFIDFMLVR